MNAAVPTAALQAADAETLTLQVRSIRMEAEGIHAFELVDPNGGDLPATEAGAHVDVHLPGGVVRSYSLAGDPQDRRRWLLGVLREPKSRGDHRLPIERLRPAKAHRG